MCYSNGGSSSIYYCSGDPISTLPGCSWRSYLPFVWSTLLEADLPLEYSQADFLAYFWIHCRNVSGGTAGLTTQFGQLLLHLSGGTIFGAVMVGTLGSALGTNLINNVPMAVVMTSSLHAIQHAPFAIRQGFIAATIFGCDLGPNLTL